MISISNSEDHCIWELSASGMFSFSSAWVLIRKGSIKSTIYSNCWYKHLPTKVSVFLWKLIHNGQPMNLTVKRRGIPIVSKCCCCPQRPFTEFNNHMFPISEIATYVWSFYMNLLQVDGDAQTINHTLSNWWHLAKGKSLYAWLQKIVPSLVLWHIWKARNLAL